MTFGLRYPWFFINMDRNQELSKQKTTNNIYYRFYLFKRGFLLHLTISYKSFIRDLPTILLFKQYCREILIDLKNNESVPIRRYAIMTIV